MSSSTTVFTDHERLMTVILRAYAVPMSAQDIMAALFEDWNQTTYLKNVVRCLNGLVRKGLVVRTLTVEGYLFTLTADGGDVAITHAEKLANEEVVPQ